MPQTDAHPESLLAGGIIFVIETTGHVSATHSLFRRNLCLFFASVKLSLSGLMHQLFCFFACA